MPPPPFPPMICTRACAERLHSRPSPIRLNPGFLPSLLLNLFATGDLAIPGRHRSRSPGKKTPKKKRATDSRACESVSTDRAVARCSGAARHDTTARERHTAAGSAPPHSCSTTPSLRTRVHACLLLCTHTHEYSVTARSASCVDTHARTHKYTRTHTHSRTRSPPGPGAGRFVSYLRSFLPTSLVALASNSLQQKGRAVGRSLRRAVVTAVGVGPPPACLPAPLTPPRRTSPHVGKVLGVRPGPGAGRGS